MEKQIYIFVLLLGFCQIIKNQSCQQNEVVKLQEEIQELKKYIYKIEGKNEQTIDPNGRREHQIIQSDPDANQKLWKAKTCQKIRIVHDLCHQPVYLVFNNIMLQTTNDNWTNLFKNYNIILEVEQVDLPVVDNLQGAKLVRACENGCPDVYLLWKNDTFRTLIVDHYSFHTCGFDFSKIQVYPKVKSAIDVGKISVWD